ncbi:hypothetical protein P879_03152 [Paragonimus westermani]|uniref:Uncharacterized protein n=1 Tax=Paragonimus westermani TaxID=34504 RepID=A0A8T0DSS1_9TREM|nr:hypothetical protein P879_03152 [Paragonimus westermani]
MKQSVQTARTITTVISFDVRMIHSVLSG